MNRVAAIGFDLFDTLITIEPGTLHQATDRLIGSLRAAGLAFEDDAFKKAHRDAAMGFLERSRREGIETHNRFWISAALQGLGHDVLPDDPRISEGVNDYFSVFYRNCQPIPGTCEMLERLKVRYPLGLLSNLTHAPAGWEIIRRLGLAPLFDVVLISGDLGYRKPHPLVFDRLVQGLGAERGRILFVGDDVESDVLGAQRAGLRPVWTTYTRDLNLRYVSFIVSGDGHPPDPAVPRIHGWADLLALLGEA